MNSAKAFFPAVLRSRNSPKYHELTEALMMDMTVPASILGLKLFPDAPFKRKARASANLSSTSIMRDKYACLAEVLRPAMSTTWRVRGCEAL